MSITKLVSSIAAIIIISILAGMCFEINGSTDILIVQSPWDGTLTYYTTPGVKPQWFGNTTTYPKRDMYEFEVQVRFNDGGHGVMKGSVQFEYPYDNEHLYLIHTKFGNPDAVKQKIIKTVTDKSIYMTGPLMSSKESYAEKRNYLITYPEDQIANGVYKTIQKDIKVRDELGNEKSQTIVEIVQKNGMPERQEASILGEFGMRAFNFAIASLPYDDAVEAQIKQQQQITMDVQTAIATAKKAEQNAITVAKEGEANAARAKWEQEVIKAKAVTEAEQKLAVSTLDAQSAEQYKKKKILEADGDATYKSRIINADGALSLKAQTWLEAQKIWANAFATHQGNLVPQIVMGNGTSSNITQNGATMLMDLLTAKTAKDLNFDLGVKK